MSSTMFNKPLDTEFVGKLNGVDERLDTLSEQVGTLRNGTVLRTVTSDGVKSLSQLISELFANISLEYGMIILYNNATLYRLYHLKGKEFVYVGGYDTGYTQLIVRIINGQTNKFAEGVGSFNSLSDYSSNVPSAGSSVFKIISFKQ